jgi:hypothetical protein
MYTIVGYNTYSICSINNSAGMWAHMQAHNTIHTHFDHYRGHFGVIQRQLIAEWKRKMSELLQAGFTDRFSCYSTWVSIIFACLGAIAIVTLVGLIYQGTNAAIQSCCYKNYK